jgi:hypothetical protein
MRIITAAHVRTAVRDTLARWLPYYLDQVNRELPTARTRLPVPREWRQPLTRAGIPRLDLAPLVVVTTTGVTEVERNAEDVDGAFEVYVDCIVQGSDYDDTAELVAVYAAAVRVALDQHPALGIGEGDDYEAGFASDTRFVSDEPPTIDEAQQKTFGEAVARFEVWVAAIHALYGPTEPPAPPYVDFTIPTVLTTDVDIAPETEPLEE